MGNKGPLSYSLGMFTVPHESSFPLHVFTSSRYSLMLSSYPLLWVPSSIFLVCSRPKLGIHFYLPCVLHALSILSSLIWNHNSCSTYWWLNITKLLIMQLSTASCYTLSVTYDSYEENVLLHFKVSLSFRPWRWKRCVPPKRLAFCLLLVVVTAVGTLNPTCCLQFALK
jgi:hypothetical protein